MKTVEAARGKWVGIFRHFGVDDRYLNPKKHTDCPLCSGGKDRFRFADHEGRGNFFCNQCYPNGGSAFDFLIDWTGKDFKAIAREIDGVIGNIEIEQPKPKADPLKRLQRLESGVVSMDGINPVRLYLKSRGLHPTAVIQYSPSVAYYEDGRLVGDYPAMLCKLVSPEGHNMTYHVTHLTDRGTKAPVSSVKKMMPPVGDLAGSAIRLFPIAEHIGIAEGVETALAVHKIFDIPCWATSDANKMAQFIPPEGVKQVSIFGDHDKSFTGQKAAYTLANRLIRTIPVSVCIPTVMGTDWADELNNGSKQA